MPWPHRLAGGWNRLGRENPLGAILTVHGEVGEWDLERFLITGRDEVQRFVSRLGEVVPSAGRGRALDFGCGVGRISHHLADHWREVIGVDSAGSMIERARRLNADRPHCTFVLNRAPDLRRFPAASFDVVYCRLVLQHVRPALAADYVGELVRVLAPGGALMLQLPEDMSGVMRRQFERAPVDGALKRLLPRPLVVAWRRLKYWAGAPPIMMFGLPRDAVVDRIRRAGGTVVAAFPDASHGGDEPGFEYWVTKGAEVRAV